MLLGRKTYAVTPRISAPCKAGTPGRAGRGLEGEKAFFSLVVDQRNLSSAGIIMGGGEKPNREFLSHKQGNSTGSSAQRGGAGLLRLGTSAGGPRERDKRGARERDKRGHESGIKEVPGMYSRVEAELWRLSRDNRNTLTQKREQLYQTHLKSMSFMNIHIKIRGRRFGPLDETGKYTLSAVFNCGFLPF